MLAYIRDSLQHVLWDILLELHCVGISSMSYDELHCVGILCFVQHVQCFTGNTSSMYVRMSSMFFSKSFRSCRSRAVRSPVRAGDESEMAGCKWRAVHSPEVTAAWAEREGRGRRQG